MKILIASLEYKPQVGGIASYVYNTAKYWPNPSDQIIIYAPAPSSRAQDNSVDWKVIRRNPFFKYIWPHWLRMLWQLWRIAKQEKIDVIHVHHALPVGYVAFILKKIKKVPYYLFLHGTDFGYAVSHKRKKHMLGKVISAADRVITNSQFLQDKVRMYYPGAAKDLWVVYPCPSLSKQKLSADKISDFARKYNPQNRPLLLTTARLVARKGQDMVIKSLPQVIKQIPNLLYLIVGRGPDQKRLHGLVTENNLEEHVRFIDFVEKEDLPYLYNLADVFIMPGREEKKQDIEGFGIVLLEAAMFGKPVIAGNSGGMPEAVADGETGILVAPDSQAEISQAIIKLFTDKELAQSLGQRGEERVADKFTWHKQLKNII